MPDFVSFGEFKDRLRETRADRHFESLRAMRSLRGAPEPERAGGTRRGPTRAAAADALPTRDEFDAEFAKMKEFLLRYYPEGMECPHSYLDSNGNFVDCIPFAQQPTARTGAAVVDRAPDPPRVVSDLPDDPLERPPLPTLLRPPLHRGLLDPFGNRVVCPSGCVTVPRITPAQLSQCGTLDRFFSKFRPAAAGAARKGGTKAKGAKGTATRTAAGRGKRAATPVPPAAGVRGHRYATCDVATPGPYFGCRSVMSVWQPNSDPGVFSLSQLWIVGNAVNGSAPCTVESGWMVYPGFQRGDGRVLGRDPVLFVFFNPDGYRLPSQGGRNGYVEGMTQTGFVRLSSGNGWPIMSSSFLRVSQPDHQVGVEMLWSLQDIPSAPGHRGWYLYMKNADSQGYDAVGYFEADTPQGYGGTQLAGQAQAVRFGGETAARQMPQGYSGYGQMGSGNPPRTDPFGSVRDVAFQTQMEVQLGGPNAPAMSVPALAPGPTDRPHYEGHLPGTGAFKSFFFFGGAGAPQTGD